MARKIILKETDLTQGSNPPDGYKYLGFNGDTLSERTGMTVSEISSSSTNLIFKAFLNQSSTNAPVISILESNLGSNISSNYMSTGIYQLVSDIPIFTANKTVVDLINFRVIGFGNTDRFFVTVLDESTIQIVSGLNGFISNDRLVETCIEITIYP